MTAAPDVMVVDSADELAATVADDTAAVLGAAVGARGVAHLVITGGSILEAVLAALTTRDVPWPQVHVWWGDERYVPADSDERNDVPAQTKLFDHVPVDPANLHRMPADDGTYADADAAAAAYADTLASFAADGADVAVPAFDVVLLGVGPDGHCASLFPGHPVTGVLDRTVAAVHDSPKPPPDRLTLTFPALCAAREVWVVASGDGKAEAVRRALAPGADRTEVPSSGARGVERTRWLLDPEAAAQLPR